MLPLRHTQGDILRWLIIALGLGTDPGNSPNASGWPVYYKSEPNTPDNVITVYATTGFIDGYSQIDGEISEHPGIQIRVRCDDSELGFQKATDIDVALQNVANSIVSIDSNYYIVHAVTRKGSIIPVGEEVPSSQRKIYTLNAIVAVTRTS